MPRKGDLWTGAGDEAVRELAKLGPVGGQAIQQVISGRVDYKIHDAMVMTNSTFTPAAEQMALSAGVVL